MEFSNESITLRRSNTSDIPSIARLANNKKIWDNLRDYMPYPYTLKDATEFVELAQELEPLTSFAIEWKGQYVGNIGMNVEKDVHRFSAEVGYWLGEPYWGNGIATTALQLISDYAFNQLELQRLHSGVYEYNKASMRVMEKAGYQLEGIWRKNVFKNGQFWDEYRYARLRE